MKIVAISDTHGNEHELVLPKGDLLIHGGDCDINNLAQLEALNRWFGQQDFRWKIFVAGNHDMYLDKISKFSIKDIMTNAIYLENDGVEIEGIKIWGSPYSPKFGHWAFMFWRDEADKIWNQIPENVDILITHGGPYQILDKTYRNEHVGCEVLTKKVAQIKPRYHIFGHIHESYGIVKNEYTTFINASLMNFHYDLVNKPHIFELEKK